MCGRQTNWIWLVAIHLRVVNLLGRCEQKHQCKAALLGSLTAAQEALFPDAANGVGVYVLCAQMLHSPLS